MSIPTCLRCGIPMPRRVRPSGNRESFVKFKQRQHCSADCRFGRPIKPLAPRPEIPCGICGTPTKNAGYCSKQCYGVALTRTPVTEKQGRNQAQKRYRLQPCRVCGATTNIHRHHIDGNPTNNRPENIDFLCQPHHYDLHRPLT